MGGQLLSKSDNPALVYTSLRRLTEEGHHVAVVFESRLLRAVQQNKHEVALYLIKNKIDLNVVEHGFSAMNLSIHRRNREVVDALINSGMLVTCRVMYFSCTFSKYFLLSHW